MTSPDAIQIFAAAEGVILTSLATALNNIGTGVSALDTLITNLQAQLAAGAPLTQAQQDALNAVITASQGLVTQANAISTTPPGTPVPVTPAP